MLVYKNRNSILFRAMALVLVYLFLVNDLSWANPNTLSPRVGNPDTYIGLEQEMQRKYDLHNDVSIDPFIKSHLDSIYSLTGRIDPNHDYAGERKASRKALEEALTNSGAKGLLDKLENKIKVFNKATGKTEKGVQIQLLILKDDEEFPMFEGEEVRGHASNKYLTIFVREKELSDVPSIVGKIFHEIRARSHRPDQELKEFERINRKIELEVKTSGRILDPALRNEFSYLEFPEDLNITHRDYTAKEPRPMRINKVTYPHLFEVVKELRTLKPYSMSSISKYFSDSSLFVRKLLDVFSFERLVEARRELSRLYGHPAPEYRSGSNDPFDMIIYDALERALSQGIEFKHPSMAYLRTAVRDRNVGYLLPLQFIGMATSNPEDLDVLRFLSTPENGHDSRVIEEAGERLAELVRTDILAMIPPGDQAEVHRSMLAKEYLRLLSSAASSLEEAMGHIEPNWRNIMPRIEKALKERDVIEIENFFKDEFDTLVDLFDAKQRILESSSSLEKEFERNLGDTQALIGELMARMFRLFSVGKLLIMATNEPKPKIVNKEAEVCIEQSFEALFKATEISEQLKNSYEDEISKRFYKALGRNPTPKELEVVWQAHLTQAEGETGNIGKPDTDGIYRNSTLSPETRQIKYNILAESGYFNKDQNKDQIKKLFDYGACGEEEKDEDYILDPRTDLTKAFPDNSRPLKIEVGFGVGNNLVKTAKKDKNSNYSGIEYSTHLVEDLNDRIKAMEHPPSNLMLINARDISVFASQKKNIISEIYYIAVQVRGDIKTVLQYVPDGISEIVRVLKPGGRIFISSDLDLPQMYDYFVSHGFKDVVKNNQEPWRVFPYQTEHFVGLEQHFYVLEKKSDNGAAKKQARRKPGSNKPFGRRNYKPDQDENTPLDENPPLVPNPATYAEANARHSAAAKPAAEATKSGKTGAFSLTQILTEETLERARRSVENRLRKVYSNRNGIDYKHCASVGVEEAIINFDPTKGASLSGWIYNKGLKAAIDAVRKEAGRVGNKGRLRPSPKQFPQVANGGESNAAYEDSVSGHDNEREETAKDAAIFFDERCKNLLSPAAELLVRLRYFEGKTLKEIGNILNKDESTISNLIAHIIDDLRVGKYTTTDFYLTDSIVSRHFGRRIRRVREALGLQQENFASMLDMTKWTIIGWESERHLPRSYNAIANLAVTTGIPLEYLLKGEKSDVANIRMKEMLDSLVQANQSSIEAEGLAQGAIPESATPAALPAAGGTGTAEGGMTNPESVQQWISEGNMAALAAQITRGMQGLSITDAQADIGNIISQLTDQQRKELRVQLITYAASKDEHQKRLALLALERIALFPAVAMKREAASGGAAAEYEKLVQESTPEELVRAINNFGAKKDMLRRLLTSNPTKLKEFEELLSQAKLDKLKYALGHYFHNLIGLMEAKISIWRTNNVNIGFVELLEPRLKILGQDWPRSSDYYKLEGAYEVYKNRVLPWIDELHGLLDQCSPEYREDVVELLNDTRNIIVSQLLPDIEFWMAKGREERGAVPIPATSAAPAASPAGQASGTATEQIANILSLTRVSPQDTPAGVVNRIAFKSAELLKPLLTEGAAIVKGLSVEEPLSETTRQKLLRLNQIVENLTPVADSLLEGLEKRALEEKEKNKELSMVLEGIHTRFVHYIRNALYGTTQAATYCLEQNKIEGWVVGTDIIEILDQALKDAAVLRELRLRDLDGTYDIYLTPTDKGKVSVEEAYPIVIEKFGNNSQAASPSPSGGAAAPKQLSDTENDVLRIVNESPAQLEAKIIAQRLGIATEEVKRCLENLTNSGKILKSSGWYYSTEYANSNSPYNNAGAVIKDQTAIRRLSEDTYRFYGGTVVDVAKCFNTIVGVHTMNLAGQVSATFTKREELFRKIVQKMYDVREKYTESTDSLYHYWEDVLVFHEARPDFEISRYRQDVLAGFKVAIELKEVFEEMAKEPLGELGLSKEWEPEIYKSIQYSMIMVQNYTRVIRPIATAIEDEARQVASATEAIEARPPNLDHERNSGADTKPMESGLDIMARQLISEAWVLVEEAFAGVTADINTRLLAQVVNEHKKAEVITDDKIRDGKAGFIFSEITTFGDEKEGKDAQGLGIVLPQLANKGIRIAVLLSSDPEKQARQGKLIEELNQKIDSPDKRIRCGTSVGEINGQFADLKDERPARFYYLKTGAEPPIDGVIDSISIAVREILRILGRLCGIIKEGQEPDKLYEAAKKFAQAA